MNFVLDASVSRSWAFVDEKDEYSKYVKGLLADSSAYVPSLWSFEVLNVVELAVRKGRIKRESATKYYLKIKELPIILDELGHNYIINNLRPFVEKYEKQKLSAYEASYLEVAIRRKLPLATNDRGLKKVAKAHGVGLIEI